MDHTASSAHDLPAPHSPERALMFERFLQPAPAPTTAMERAGAECDRTLEVRDRAVAAISASFETVS